MSHSQYTWNNGDIIVHHGNVLSVFDRDTWTMTFPCPPGTTYDVPPSKYSTGCYQRAPAELSTAEFIFPRVFSFGWHILHTLILFCRVRNSSHIIRDLRHRFQQMWSIQMKNTFQDNYTISDTNNAHPEEILTLLHFPNTAVFSNRKQTVIMYLMCAPTCVCTCLCMKLKLECLFWKAAIFFTLLQKID
jgi:hypothetical protein